MRYPELVRRKDCKTPITVRIEAEELTEDGAPEILLEADLLCNWQDSAKRILTSEQKVIELTGTAYFPGDIAPDAPSITGGTVIIFGETRRIQSGTKGRNPDGTVNYTKLEVI